MPRAFTASVVTANDLLEGDVIYQTAAVTWTRRLEQAEVLTDEAHAQIRLVEASAKPEAIGAYLADVAPDGPAPVHFREDFRRRGPSNYFHGKQAAL